MDNSNLYQWQADILGGLKKGELHIISCGRRTGKSILAMQYMQRAVFTGSWNDWQEIWVWPWKSRKSSISGKIIWGHIHKRSNKLVLTGKGNDYYQYATKKEVFVKTLKDNGQGW